MAVLLPETNFALPAFQEGITRANFIAYTDWTRTAGELRRAVIEPFEEAIHGATGYSDELRPEKTKKVPVKVESIEFLVEVTPCRKSPPYKEAFERTKHYLEALMFQPDPYLKAGSERIDTLDLDGERYVNINHAQHMIKSFLEQVRKDRDGVRFTILEKNPATPVEFGETLSLAPTDYSARTDSNARKYIEAEKFLAEGNYRAQPFKSALLDDSNAHILAMAEEFEEITDKIPYPFSGVVFVHKVIPAMSYSYLEALNSLIREKPHGYVFEKSIGVLELARLFVDHEERLKEQGLDVESFREKYNPFRDSKRKKIYVKLSGLEATLRENLVQTETDKQPTQRIVTYLSS